MKEASEIQTIALIYPQTQRGSLSISYSTPNYRLKEVRISVELVTDPFALSFSSHFSFAAISTFFGKFRQSQSDAIVDCDGLVELIFTFIDDELYFGIDMLAPIPRNKGNLTQDAKIIVPTNLQICNIDELIQFLENLDDQLV